MGLAIRNIKKNKMDYIIYGTTLILSVSILYTFSSIMFSKEVGSIIDTYNKLDGIFYMAIIMVMLVLSTFVWYANKFFIRKRKKELGIFSLVGMENNKISNMILKELMLVGLGAAGVGTLLGAVLSKITFSIYTSILGQAFTGTIPFINTKAILITNGLFLFFFYLVALNSASVIDKFKLIDLFGGDKKREEGFKKPLIKGIPAVVIIIIGYITYPWSFATLGLTIIVTTVIVIKGTYKLFSTRIMKNLIIRKEKLNLENGIENIALANVLFRLKSNSRMLSSISVLIASNITVIGVCATLYFSDESMDAMIGNIFFIGICISLVFAFCTLSILLFKLIREAFDEKERFKILYKIGFDHYEIKKIITTELKFYFGTPIKIGMVHALVALSVTILGLAEKFLLVIGGVMLVYSVIYLIYFLITRELYMKIIEDGIK
ncbi:FtsX-like permease family protein [Clostridium sp. LIBA-8841]|uniref:FtsX-like permease family protein n=1 Tax=Clostridium sp. LIBA-8841 TaxID=2987530 RepID=UPI002AC6FCD0|nr:FtsX-like permease family protein [Clostridium sp. LIBA-8841]MDZ5253539.1 FtsX-like permease family protein [Clostridium sp. LIBA-8841]